MSKHVTGLPPQPKKKVYGQICLQTLGLHQRSSLEPFYCSPFSVRSSSHHLLQCWFCLKLCLNPELKHPNKTPSSELKAQEALTVTNNCSQPIRMTQSTLFLDRKLAVLQQKPWNQILALTLFSYLTGWIKTSFTLRPAAFLYFLDILFVHHRVNEFPRLMSVVTQSQEMSFVFIETSSQLSSTLTIVVNMKNKAGESETNTSK